MPAPAYRPEAVPLQTDWLRLKSHLFDPATGLPTLAAVLEDVRRLLEERETVALVYIDIGGGSRLEARHGWQEYDATVNTAAEALKQSCAERDVVLAVMGARSDKFIVFDAGIADSVAAEASAAAFHDHVARALETEGRRRGVPVLVGAGLVHRDPMLRAERAVHRALDDAMFRSLQRRSRDEEVQGRWLERVIAERDVVPVFQPVVDLTGMNVVGQEVSTRGPAGGLIEEPGALFALAERIGQATTFERVCRHAALRAYATHRPEGRTLFVKTSPAALVEPQLAADGLTREIEGAGLEAHDVVVEVQERLAALDRRALRAALRALKTQGFRVAIDDMGAGYSSLQSIAEMEPAFLKFDMSLVRHLDRSPIKRSLLETVVRVSGSVAAPVIACGIETRAELATIRDMGVPLGQGQYLGPAEALPPAASEL